MPIRVERDGWLKNAIACWNHRAGWELYAFSDQPEVTTRFQKNCQYCATAYSARTHQVSWTDPVPRPALPEEVDAYESALRRRLNARPGMTGLWQVSGRSDLPFEDYVRLDLTYARNWGLLLDAYILLRTIPVVLGAKGAY